MTTFSHAIVRTKINSLSNCSVLKKVSLSVLSVDDRSGAVLQSMYLMGCLDSSNTYCYWVSDDIYADPENTVPQFTGSIRNQSIIRRL